MVDRTSCVAGFEDGALVQFDVEMGAVVAMAAGAERVGGGGFR
jgi:hypothetical protein